MDTSTTLHIIVGNLNRRKDRWESIFQHLQQFKNVSITRIAAVDLPTNPAKGCRETHKKGIEYAKENNWEKFLFLEDDARLRDNFEELYSLVMPELPDSWKLVFLGPGRVKGFTYHSEHLLRLKRNSDSNYITGSHAIIYRKSVYDDCIQLLEKEDCLSHTDLILSNSQEIISPEKIFITVPYLADFCTNSNSDVRKEKDTSLDVVILLETEKNLNGLMRKYENLITKKHEGTKK